MRADLEEVEMQDDELFGNKTILITGGTGSFGRRFIRRLLQSCNPSRVIVYSRDEMKQFEMEREFDHPAMRCLRGLWEKELGRTSVQVLSEYYVTVTAKLSPGLPAAVARSDIRALSVWRPLEISTAVMEGAWDVQDQYGYGWWDSLVIASALFLDCAWLLSEDMQHGQHIGPLTILNPFQAEAGGQLPEFL